MILGGFLSTLGGKNKSDKSNAERVKIDRENSIDTLPNWQSVRPGDKSKSPEIKELLSKPAGPFKELDDSHRTCMAVVKDSFHCKNEADVLLLVSPGKHSSDVMYFVKEIIKQNEYNLVSTYQASSTFIGGLYEDMMFLDGDAQLELDEGDEWIIEEFGEIVKYAVENNASDFHLTLRGQLNIKFRVNGYLIQPHNNLPHSEGVKLITGIYNLYIGETTGEDFNAKERTDASFNFPVEIDGKSRVVRMRYTQAPGAPMDSRKESIDVVVRINSNGSQLKIVDFKGLGFDVQSIDLLNALTYKKRGLILLVGETGSGKSSTLKAVFNGITENSGDSRKIISLEDPPEGHIPHTNIQPLRTEKMDGFDREALKSAAVQAIGSAMRQDPDVLGVGEIRYPEVATLALEASLTGHLVGTTLHASRWIDAYSRIIEFYKIHPSILCSNGMVQAVIAQKLTPKVCQHCALTYEEIKAQNYYADTASIDKFIHKNCKQIDSVISDDQKSYYKRLSIDPKIWDRDYSKLRFINTKPTNDCSHCNPKGVAGRVLLYEIFIPSRHKESMKHLLNRDFDAAMYEWLNCKDKKTSLIDGFSLEKRAIDSAKQGIICTMEAVSLLSDV